MKTIRNIIITLVVVVIIVVVAIAVISNDETNPLNGLANEAKATATNSIMDTGIAGQIEDLINSHVDDIANITGLSTSQIESAVEDLNIDEWTAISLPDGAVATRTVDANAYGIDGTITLYEDPSYITLEAFGQTITFEIPESAQALLSFL